MIAMAVRQDESEPTLCTNCRDTARPDHPVKWPTLDAATCVSRARTGTEADPAWNWPLLRTAIAETYGASSISATEPRPGDRP